MDRIDIINSLIEKNGYKTYLEIGVRNPDDCFNHIKCDNKTSVDPGYEFDCVVDYKMTSDDFFNQNNIKYDIIFIDGNHIDEQVERDINNSLMFLTPNGSIVLHDCNPPDIYFAREDYLDTSTSAQGFWNGTVWKSIVNFRSSDYALSYECNVVDTDWGVGIIRRKQNNVRIINDNYYYSFRKFEKNKKYYLGLISTQEFYKEYLI
jgi:hypothetical protein